MNISQNISEEKFAGMTNGGFSDDGETYPFSAAEERQKAYANDPQVSQLLILAHSKAAEQKNKTAQQLALQNNGCCECYSITATDFQDPSDPLFPNAPLTQTFVISTPGKYVLNADTVFVPLVSGTPAILILSNNVVLDLCEHTLSQGNLTANAYGVQLGLGFQTVPIDRDFVLQNVTVQNGTIRQFTGAGIFAWNKSFTVPTAMVAFQDLHFLDLNILECGVDGDAVHEASGIYLSSDAPNVGPEARDPVPFKNVIIRNCHVNRCRGNSAILVYRVEHLIAQDTEANDFVNVQITIQSPLTMAFRGREIAVLRCRVNGLKSLDPVTAAQCTPLDIENSFNVTVKDSQFNDAFGEASSIVNSNFSYTHNMLVENTQFNNNRGGLRARIVAGVHLSDSANRQYQAQAQKYVNCQFNGMRIDPANTVATGGNGLVCGFTAITASNFIFENCQFSNISTADSSLPIDTYGIVLQSYPSDPAFPFADVNNMTLVDCVVSDIAGNRRVCGIALESADRNRTSRQSSLRNTVVKNCIVERISSSSSVNHTYGIGETLFTEVFVPVRFGSFPQQLNLFFADNRVSQVRAGAGNPLSAGILVEAVINPELLRNSVVDCDRGILLAGTNLINPPFQFQLANALVDVVATPPLPINLTSIPAAPAALQIFTNVTRGNSISVAPAATTISLTTDVIVSPTNLNTLSWRAGDIIQYDSNGGPAIGGLVTGQSYFLIVYVPGFSTRGLIKENNVSNNSVSGFEDISTPCTSSAWLANTAFCNGPEGNNNYVINWGHCAPVAKGSLSRYPVPKSYIENVSITCGRCDCRKK